MPRATITNAVFDAACAAIAAPYGPLTRVSNLEVAPTVSPNSNIKYETTSVVGVTVYISYEELVNTVQAADIIKQAHGVNAVLQDIQDMITALNSVLNGTNYNPLTADPNDYREIVLAIGAFVPLAAALPFKAYDEVGDSNTILLADFTYAQVDATLESTITLTNTSTGLYHFIMVDWDDGEIALVRSSDDLVHVYPRAAPLAGDDTYNVRLVLIGPQGISTATDAILVPDQA